MNIKLLSVLSVFVIVFSCKKNNENNNLDITKTIENQKITSKDISKIKYTDYILDSRSDDIILSWNEYTQFQDVVTNVKKGNLSFFNDNKNEIKRLLLNLKQSIPNEYNTSSILARIAAFETKLLKLESLSNLSTTSKQELLSTIKEFLVAFSNLNLQMNKKLEADNIIIEKP